MDTMKVLYTNLLAYHYPRSDTSNNNLVLVGCVGWDYYSNVSGLFLNDPDPIYRNLDTLGSLVPVSA